MGTMEDLEEWVWPKVEAWAHVVRTLVKTSKPYPHSEYAGLGISLQIECQYLKSTIPGVGSLMGPIDDALREAFFYATFGGEEVSDNIREILGHSMKHGGLGIPEHQMLTDRAYNISKAAIEVLLGSLFGGTKLNYVAYKGCVHRASDDGWKQ